MKMTVTVAGYVTDGDRQSIERQLKRHVCPILGDIEILWRGRTGDGRPSFAVENLEPGLALRLRPALNEVFGVRCAVSLKEKSAAAA